MATEFNLYIIGNWCIFLAGCLILKDHLMDLWGSKKSMSSAQYLQQSTAPGSSGRLTIARDTEVLLFLSTIARMYWSCSPPELWHHDPYMTKYICVTDLIASAFLWTTILVVGLWNQQPYRSNKSDNGQQIIPTWARWPCLFLLSLLVFGPIGRMCIDQEHANINHAKGAAFPYADFAIMVNISLDTLAMIPQIFVISRGQDDMCSRATGNVVGLMGAARIFRMCFWVISMVINYLATGGYILWYFILPDLVHTIIMGEYVWVWAHRLRKETADLFAI